MLLAFTFGFAQPTANAPTPTNLASNVISIYSDSFTNIATNYNPGWGQSGAVNTTFVPVSGSGNNVMAYTNFNYQGTDLTSTNASSMEFLHIDIWTSTATNVKVSPINNGAGATGASEFLVNVPLVSGGWSSVDIPKSAFTGMTWDAVAQLKFDGQGGTSPSTIYLDNIYFYKVPVVAAADATLSNLTVNGTTITGFSPSTLSYTYSLPNGTTVVPTVAATATQATSNAVVTQASALPGTSSVLVTSQNGSTKTYTVNFVLTGPNVAAPTPTIPAANVISLFSNAYTNIAIDAWSASWDDSSVTDMQVAGNDIKKINFTNFLGVDFSGPGHHKNMTNATRFHMDVWVDSLPVGYVFNPKFSQWGGTSGEVSAFLLNVNGGTSPSLSTGQWVSIDVPITQFTGTLTRNDVAQLILSSNIGTVYVDNIYVYNPVSVLATNEVSATNKKIKMYPNPVTAGENITISSKIKNGEIYNINGQKVKSFSSQNVNSQGLEKGVYIIEVTTENGAAESTKLIVK